LRPDGKVGHDAFTGIREMNKVAIRRVVFPKVIEFAARQSGWKCSVNQDERASPGS